MISIIYFAEHNIYEIIAYNQDLNIVTNNVAFANTLSYIKPEDNFCSYKSVQGSLFDSLVLPRASLSTCQQFANTRFDLRDFTQFWGSQFNSRIFHEDVKFRTGLCDCRWKIKKLILLSQDRACQSIVHHVYDNFHLFVINKNYVLSIV